MANKRIAEKNTTNISGLVITLNEEKNIKECINSLFNVCNEVIIVDSNSSDKTVEIAEEAGAKVIVQKFLGDGPQRSHGLKYCTNDWILNIDADERLDFDAIEEIKKLNLEKNIYEAFEFKRKNFLHNKWIKVAGWYPDFIRRLFNKNLTDFSPVKTHTKILSTKYKKLDSHIIHYSFENYHDMLNILNKYSTWQANSLFGKGVKAHIYTPFTHFCFSFFKHYFLKRGFLAGFDGFNISLLNALGSYFKYAKLLEKTKYKKS